MGVVAVIVCGMNDNSQIIMQAKKVDLDIFCSASAGFLLYIYWVVGVYVCVSGCQGIDMLGLDVFFPRAEKSPYMLSDTPLCISRLKRSHACPSTPSLTRTLYLSFSSSAVCALIPAAIFAASIFIFLRKSCINNQLFFCFYLICKSSLACVVFSFLLFS